MATGRVPTDVPLGDYDVVVLLDQRRYSGAVRVHPAGVGRIVLNELSPSHTYAFDIAYRPDESKSSGKQEEVVDILLPAATIGAHARLFATHFLSPALHEAEALGISAPLGHAVVYDSRVHGGWSTLKGRIGPVDGRGGQDWVRRYIALRRAWLLSLSPPLPTTVYRMDAFNALVDQQRWNLELPLSVRGVAIAADLLPAAGNDGRVSRVLRLSTPYLRGDDVKAVQAALASRGRQIIEDASMDPTHTRSSRPGSPRRASSRTVSDR